MRHEKNFKAFTTTFADPSDIDDCTLMYSDPEEGGCDCGPRVEIVTSQGESRCRFCGRRVA